MRAGLWRTCSTTKIAGATIRTACCLAKHYADRRSKKTRTNRSRDCRVDGRDFERDLDRAKSEADIAVSLNPNSALAYKCLGTYTLFGKAAGGYSSDRARHAPRPRITSAISPLPWLGKSARRQVRDCGSSAEAAYFAGSRDGFFPRHTHFRSWSSRRCRRGPSRLARTQKNQSEILIQRTFRDNPSAKRMSKGLPWVSPKPDCRTNKLTSYSKISVLMTEMALPKVRAEIPSEGGRRASPRLGAAMWSAMPRTSIFAMPAGAGSRLATLCRTYCPGPRSRRPAFSHPSGIN